MAIFALVPLFMILAVIGVIATSFGTEITSHVIEPVENEPAEVTYPLAA